MQNLSYKFVTIHKGTTNLTRVASLWLLIVIGIDSYTDTINNIHL